MRESVWRRGGIELLGSAKLDGGRGREILRWRQWCLTWVLEGPKRPGDGDCAAMFPLSSSALRVSSICKPVAYINLLTTVYKTLRPNQEPTVV